MTDLFERTWPTSTAKGAVVIVHGLAEHSGRYDYVAQSLNKAGYAVYAQDARGHGRSIGFPGDMGGDPARVVQDVVEFCVRVHGEHDATFLLGHSMGTLFAVSAVAQMPVGTLKGLVLSGTVAEPGPASQELIEKGRVPPESVSRDPEIVQAYADDPLVFEKTPPELMALAGEVTAKYFEAIPLITIPVLLVHGEDDLLTAVGGARMVHTQLVTTDKTLIEYPGLYHEVFNEPEKDKVIADVVSWLDDHVAADAPS
ncbi:MAG TPA: alpha/beta hydrolase [Actinomycetota bacterium]|nr:alpha/beta hydrolase [Actinomycetota bacterium]